MKNFLMALGYFFAWFAVLFVLFASYVVAFQYGHQTAPCPLPPIVEEEVSPKPAQPAVEKPAPPKAEAPKVLPKPKPKARPKAKPADCDRAKQHAKSYAELMTLAKQAGITLTIAERRAAAACFRA